MNEIVDSLSKISFLNSPEYRKARGDLIERCKGALRITYPEMFDPFQYQQNRDYVGLEVAELILIDVFKKYDVNFRMPYESRKFDLPELVADLTITLEMSFPDVKLAFDHVLSLAMVHYLAECLCELMEVRDTELEEILKFHRRKAYGEWEPEKHEDKGLTEKVLRSVEVLRKEERKPEPEPVKEDLDEAGLRVEIEKLREKPAEKEAVLAEAEQKAIQQRALYENEKTRREQLEEAAEESAIEHAELIALREYVYNEKTTASDNADETDLDEQTREQIIDKIQEKRVAVLGGTERWIKRMKRLLPAWSFVSVHDGNRGSLLALERADYVYIYTDALKHSQYYRAMSIVKNKNKMLYYLGSSNVDECLRQFERELGRI